MRRQSMTDQVCRGPGGGGGGTHSGIVVYCISLPDHAPTTKGNFPFDVVEEFSRFISCGILLSCGSYFNHVCIYPCSTVDRVIDNLNRLAATDETTGVEETLANLTNPLIDVGLVDELCASRYHTALQEARREKGEPLTQEEMKRIVEEVNEQVRQERLSK